MTATDAPTDTAPPGPSRKPSGAMIALIAVGAVLALLVVGAVAVFLALNSNQKAMVARESALSAQYQANQNELSTYISTIKESLGVADRTTDQLDRVLADAVKGRYEGDTTARPGSGQMFSAIIEAYPDLSGVTVNYAKVQDAVFAGRQGYKDVQNKLLDMLREYDTWRNSGFIHSKMVSLVGAPSDNLEARIGDRVATGSEARTEMLRIVLTPESKRAYESGEMDPLDTNPGRG